MSLTKRRLEERELTRRQQDMADILVTEGRTPEFETLVELERRGIENAPQPEKCPKCGGELEESQGYVGETVLFCPNQNCEQGVVWEDSEDAIRRVI